MSTLAPDHHARRLALAHAVSAEADRLMRDEDLRPHYDDHERAVRLQACVGDVAHELTVNRGLDLDGALILLAAEVTIWLEHRAAEASR